MNPSFPAQQHDRGAAAVIVAISMLVLMGVAALVVDIGAGFNERAQDQSAADAGALAGAVEWFMSVDPTAPTNETQLRAAITQIVREDLDTTYDDAAWDSAWATCSDSDFLTSNPQFAPLSTTNCISLSADSIRVRVPDQIVNGTFSRIIGIDELRTHAGAVSGIDIAGSGGVLPFGLLGGVGAGEEYCLSTAPGGKAVPPCGGPSSGNFGTIQAVLFGSEKLGTTEDCSIPSSPELASNIALGIDHPIFTNPLGLGYPVPGAPPQGDAQGNKNTPPVWHRDKCDETGTGLAGPEWGLSSQLPINTLNADTGLDVAGTMMGLVSESAPTFGGAFGKPKVESRLQQIPVGWDSITLRSKEQGSPEDWVVDNRPLWDFIDTDASTGLCKNVTNRDELTACLAQPQHLVLRAEVIESPRLGWVPQFWYEEWASGNHWQPIYGLQPVWLSGLWFNCKKTPPGNVPDCTGTGSIEFYPGDPGSVLCDGDATCTSVKQLSLDQVGGYILPKSALKKTGFEEGPAGTPLPFSIELRR